MRYRFGDYELDVHQRELRHRGESQPIQAQVFDLLVYLVKHRDRVVSKDEILDAIWPDVAVTEGSLQRAVSLARSSLRLEDREFIRTFVRRGYRFTAEVEEKGDGAPSFSLHARPRYAQSGDVHVAYQTFGEGDLDIVLVLGWTFPMQALLELPEGAALVRRLGALGRVVLFDKRGTGLSDRVKELPTLDQRIDDLRAVLREIGTERSVLLGASEGGPLAIAFSVEHPERVAGLALVGAFPRMTSAPDYPHGWKRSEVGRLRSYVRSQWGLGATVIAFASDRRDSEPVKKWAAAAEAAGASPGAAHDLLEMNVRIDVRDRLARLRVPCTILHATDDLVISVENGRYLAERIQGARYVEVAGDDHAFLFAGQDRLVAEIERLVRSEP